MWGRVLSDLLLESVLTCPVCGYRKAEPMPIDACLYFYTCSSCGARLKPRLGDCCVFCSYGSARCPSRQEGSVSEPGLA